MKKVAIVLFIISLCWRLVMLYAGPNSLTHDEIDFYYSGYKLAHTGTDQYGNTFFLTTGYISAIPSVPVYISAIGWKFLSEKTPINARLPFVLLNSLTPVILFFIVLILSKKPFLSYLSFIVFCFSPWFSHVSARVPYDSPVALLFFLASFLVIISSLPIKRKLLFFLFFNFLSFHSYMGFKTVYPLTTFISLFFLFSQQKGISNKKNILLSFLITVLFLLIQLAFLILLPKSDLVLSRASNELITPFSSSVKHYLWYAHWTTEGAHLINKLLYNKVTAWIFLFFSKYLNAWNVLIYFITGEPSGVYGLRIMGLFFLTDFFFFVYFFVHRKRAFPQLEKFILLTFLIGGVPFALSVQDVTVSLRGVILLVPYSLIISTGVYLFANTKIKKLICCSLCIINILAFSYIYLPNIKNKCRELLYN